MAHEGLASFGSDLIYLFKNEFFSVPRGGGTPRKLASMDTALDDSWMRPLLLSDGKTLAFVVDPLDTAHQAEPVEGFDAEVTGEQRNQGCYQGKEPAAEVAEPTEKKSKKKKQE